MKTILTSFAFTSDNGSHYSEGQQITQAEYENLPKYEQEFFTSKLNN